MVIKLNVETTKIDFDFAGLEVTADVSDSNIKKLLELRDGDLQEDADAAAKEVAGMNEEDVTSEDFERMYLLCVDLYGQIYEPVFGEGSFKKVYEHVGSIQSTIKAFDEALDYIITDIYKRNEEGIKARDNKLAKYKKRKKK